MLVKEVHTTMRHTGMPGAPLIPVSTYLSTQVHQLLFIWAQTRAKTTEAVCRSNHHRVLDLFCSSNRILNLTKHDNMTHECFGWHHSWGLHILSDYEPSYLAVNIDTYNLSTPLQRLQNGRGKGELRLAHWHDITWRHDMTWYDSMTLDCSIWGHCSKAISWMWPDGPEPMITNLHTHVNTHLITYQNITLAADTHFSVIPILAQSICHMHSKQRIPIVSSGAHAENVTFRLDTLIPLLS